MYKQVLTWFKSENYAEYELESEESKSLSNAETDEETCMDFVKKFRDFEKLSQSDLQNAFKKLRVRCPKTWYLKLEAVAKDFNKKVMTIREADIGKFIDPEEHKPYEIKEQNSAKDLIISPNLWNMHNKECAIELRQILHHFTLYAPFEGRPFIRAWLEALVPCFSRWILLSDSKEEIVTQTLKNILGAFGQPGIVVCLEDKGEKLLKTLQESARSVEALGRGTVEQYYWKRLVKSSCCGNKDWRTLANIPNKELTKSQLDTLPKNWLQDSKDFAHVFANIVSPELSSVFEKRLTEIIINRKVDGHVHPGPPKTLSRSIAKCHEYKSEYRSKKRTMRWINFRKSFEKSYGRSPKTPEDFVWNIVDFARCSIVVRDAGELLKAKKVIEEKFKVVCVKNGYNADVQVKGSGYRDFKMLVEVEFDELNLKEVAQAQKTIEFICEIQLICKKWLLNKVTSSLSYKILRARNLKEFLDDFSKYPKRNDEGRATTKIGANEVLKNGWVNLARITNFSNIDSDYALQQACFEGWDPHGIEILVTELHVDVQSINRKMFLVFYAAYHGHDRVVKTLIELKSNVDNQDGTGQTALHYAAEKNHEGCVRLLIDARCSLTKVDNYNCTALDIVRKKFGDNNRVVKLLKGQNVPPLKSKGKGFSKISRIKLAAMEGSLAIFFDKHCVEHSVVDKLMVLEGVAKNMENSLQVLWFGGNIEARNQLGWTPLIICAWYGDVASLKVLLEHRAKIDAKNNRGYTALQEQCFSHQLYRLDILKALVGAKANINSKSHEGWNALHLAAEHAPKQTVAVLLDSKADVMAQIDGGLTALDIAIGLPASEENDAKVALLQAAMEKVQRWASTKEVVEETKTEWLNSEEKRIRRHATQPSWSVKSNYFVCRGSTYIFE